MKTAAKPIILMQTPCEMICEQNEKSDQSDISGRMNKFATK